ncbi:MAG TPA: HAMP domain-containing sensor histidine kinase [Ramlibacter sp.]|jgi:signal transduction histidine kinase|nr:HAMP domain-containing sensor histidine kinase [Ramlibacter sp.]
MNEDLQRAGYSLLPRALFQTVLHRARRRSLTEVLQLVMEPIQSTQGRIQALALSTFIGHLLFFVIWSEWLPQPYENLALRVAMAFSGLLLLAVPGIADTPPTRTATIACSLVFWVTLPLFFSWMYFCNGGNGIWLASLGAMFLIYYHVMDWRLATFGSATGVLAGWLLFEAFGPNVRPLSGEQAASNAVILAFCWWMGITLGVSSSTLRRQQLAATLGTMGIMAHELRTPLATMQLVGDAVRNEAAQQEGEAGERLQELSQRLHNLVRTMNRQIDMQITNARFMHLAANAQRISAAELVHAAIADYPYRSSRERNAVVVQVHDDFHFLGSRQLFAQVIDNLVKNALRSLAAASSATRPGDLLIQVGAQGGRGRIVFTDNGVGMDADLRKRIFQPFFSTDRGTGHGLGLAFCKRVVQAAHGSIRVKSAPHQGAVFTIELPVA